MTIPVHALRSFLALYGAGEYWKSHEALEGAWRASRDDFAQALILLASAWVHWERDNAHGVRAQLSKTLEKLAHCPSSHHGFDVDAIRAHCAHVLAIMDSHPDSWRERIHPLDLSPPVGPGVA